MPVLCDLIGPGAPLDATTASVIGLPRAGPRGSPWRFVRAALPHSLASELTSSTDRTTLGSYVKNISAILDQRKKASLERQPVPPRSHFEEQRVYNREIKGEVRKKFKAALAVAAHDPIAERATIVRQQRRQQLPRCLPRIRTRLCKNGYVCNDL